MRQQPRHHLAFCCSLAIGLALIYLAVIGTVLGFTTYLVLVARIGTSGLCARVIPDRRTHNLDPVRGLQLDTSTPFANTVAGLVSD
ncbi:hypothetical protein [Marinobacter sp.]|uniref:hypothetical protein n=1 Tax=Marinobacter sp. TaxID=50741 RepID=UPI001B49656B|nr:hypothetical protein [Marinobacter sp.]MBQ0831023.1 hypothetical protein [Marinobacter sp.]